MSSIGKKKFNTKATPNQNIAQPPPRTDTGVSTNVTPPSEPQPMELSPSAAETAYKKIGDPVLLDKIDKLFACNVGEYIDLPQLVVVGDQSSGKSSVLEGLTRLPFPRDSGLCTKFATQITFRRAANHSIKVSILPDPNSTAEYQERVKEWNKYDIKQLDAPAFATIMSDVHTVMGLSSNIAQAPGLRKTFSNDVLRLEIHGPDEAHLSVIDVPGIFRTTTTGVTTTADKELVRHMVETYMRNPRTVMLTVVPANVDPATQEILEMAKEVDPDRHRTIGVLTKPDLVDKGAEQKIVDITKGKGLDAKLDWSVIYNPGQQELNNSIINRGVIEELFFRRIAPWNTLSRERRGIDSLRKRLEEVLTQHIRREFPKVKVEINKKLGVYKRTLDSLGAERDTADKGDGIFDTFTGIYLATELSLYGDDQVSKRLLNLLLDGLLEKYSKSLVQAKFLLDVELLGVPMTLNHYFNDNLEKRRQQRMKSAWISKSLNDCKHGSVVPLNLIMQNHPMNNADHTIRDMHDILYAYYKVARKRFVDNVCMHAVGYHLIHGPDTPLKLFSPSFVLELTQGQLQEIAGEDSSLKRKRAQLKKEIQDLEAGRKILM
ncbi:hypothetical protein K469DRAFT_744134 [Zopfia rhizophila CBS 207.26]|uniref:Uncharacterized protein n=1 Tax=Zopfia rhizophila CBS 207.26 TaxID=1314779 RepID=A0A6A6ETY5_9PEZI|nr:hypothetical protein K469DRAFT_744134 [Zopfia rhizophila CBS 207.26]